jgi:phenylalanine-4-hydroxylase
MSTVIQAGLVAAKPYLIEQDYSRYTSDEHQLWSELVARRMAQLSACACSEYLDGWSALGLEEDRIPKLSEVSRKLEKRTGWKVSPVSAFMPSRAFFEMLAARQFPTTVKLRSRESMDYTPEPDILHDALGHLPMFAHQAFADAVGEYGKLCYSISDGQALERMGRLYWYTFEFGLLRRNGEIKVYGSGVASSQAECTNVLTGGCEIRDFSVPEVLNTTVKVDEVHHLLFAIDSFDSLMAAVREAKQYVQE